MAAPSFAAPAEGASGRYLVRTRGAADLGALRAKAVADGAKVVQTIPQALNGTAPGGARKFDLGAYDRGGTPGFLVTADDLTNAWQTFSTTSNWAVEIPCFTFTAGSGFPQGQCYSTIQGTSMAAPHAAAAVALIASEHPSLRHRPGALVARLQARARSVNNHTPPVSATDTSPADLTGVACPTGFCHLGGAPISNRNAYGAGLAYVANP